MFISTSALTANTLNSNLASKKTRKLRLKFLRFGVYHLQCVLRASLYIITIGAKHVRTHEVASTDFGAGFELVLN